MDPKNGQMQADIPGPDLNGNETVLVVDDNNNLRSLLSDALSMYGYSTICAEDGIDGLLKFQENRDRIQFMLIDVVMPGKDGLELYRDVKRINPDMRILFMSGYNDVFRPDQDLLEDGTKCLFKPFTMKTLIKEMREVLDK